MRSCWWPLANIQVDTLNSRLASRILLYIFISIKRLKYAPLKFCAVRNVCAPHTQRKRHLKRSNCICSGYHEQSHKMNKKCQSIWCDWEENKYRDFRSKWFMFVLLLSHSLPYSFSQTIITLIQSFQFVMFTHFFAPHCIALHNHLCRGMARALFSICTFNVKINVYSCSCSCSCCSILLD